MRAAARFAVAAAAMIAGYGAPAAAEVLRCRISGPCPARSACAGAGVVVEFAIDRNQFVAPVATGEPPRTMVTHVRMGSEIFAAEPIVMNGGAVRGFWVGQSGAGSRLLTVGRDGVAHYSQLRPDLTMTGNCKEVG